VCVEMTWYMMIMLEHAYDMTNDDTTHPLCSLDTHTNNQGDPWVGFIGDTGVSSEDQGTDDSDAECTESKGSHLLNDDQWGEFHIMRVGMLLLQGGLLDDCFSFGHCC